MSQGFEFKKDGSDINSFVLGASDFQDGFWSSDAVSVGNFDAVEANLQFGALAPDLDDIQAGEAINYELKFRLETRVNNAEKWNTLITTAEQMNSIKGQPSERVLISNPKALNLFPGQDQFDGFDQNTSVSTKHVGGEVRLCIVLKSLGVTGSITPKDFQSLTFSADGLLFS